MVPMRERGARTRQPVIKGQYIELATAVLNVQITMGSEVMATCPYHSDSTPSFHFNVDSGLFICFGCQVRGNAVKLARDMGMPHLASGGHHYDPDAEAEALNAALALLGSSEEKCRCAEVYAAALSGSREKGVSGKRVPRRVSPRRQSVSDVSRGESRQVKYPAIKSKVYSRTLLPNEERSDDLGNSSSIVGKVSSTTDPLHPPAPQSGVSQTLHHRRRTTQTSRSTHISPVAVSSTGTEPGKCGVCGRPTLLSDRYLEKFHLPASKDLIQKHWVGRRSIHPAVVSTFGLGWSPLRQSMVIPYRNPDGLLQGVVHRQLAGRPKYRYPKHFPRKSSLFGSWALTDPKPYEAALEAGGVHMRKDVMPDRWVVLTEGSIDALSVWSAGLPAVAMWGSYLNPKQVQVLVDAEVFGVVIFTDRDSAGRQAKKQATKVLTDAGMLVRTVSYPRGYPPAYGDPGSMPPALIRTRVSHARWTWSGPGSRQA